MKKMYLLVLVCVLALGQSIPMKAGVKAEPVKKEKAEQDSVRVLWIGNSYTYFNDLPKMVQELAATKKMKMACTRVVKGGARFSGHLENENLLKLLKEGGWDYVVLQEQSANPAKPTGMVAQEVYPYAQKLCELARKGSPKAKIIFYMTWGHKYGNLQQQVENYPLDDTYAGMQERLKTSYLEMAYDNNAWCAPVGMAWKQVREERPYCILYKPDMSHPSVRGSYLAANVLFATIWQKNYQTEYNAGLDDEEAEYLQQVAISMVMKNKNLLNIK